MLPCRAAHLDREAASKRSRLSSADMNRVTVFGNADGGKSTLAKTLATITGLPLHPIDSIKYKPGGEEVPHAEYLEIHAGLLRNERWIIDGVNPSIERTGLTLLEPVAHVKRDTQP